MITYTCFIIVTNYVLDVERELKKIYTSQRLLYQAVKTTCLSNAYLIHKRPMKNSY